MSQQPDLPAILARMAAFPAALESLLRDLPPEVAYGRGPEDSWSIAEIVEHLVDEEQVDFGPRLRAVLEDPEQDWAPIDPEGLVESRRGQERSLAETLRSFASLRAESIAWLSELEGSDWQASKSHPQAGTLCAGELLASWAAHDALHLRQLAQRLHERVEEDAGFDASYAGGW